MKSYSRRRSGFTLIELLVVTVIIAILVSLVFGISGAVMDSAKKQRARVEISAIELALTEYQIDTGFYPVATNIYVTNYESTLTNYTSFMNVYTNGARVLFYGLTGRTNYNIPVASSRIYFPDLIESQIGDVEIGNAAITNKSTSRDAYTNTDLFNQGSYMKDPWGFPYGYYNADLEPNSHNNLTGPDIWSTGNVRDDTSKTNLLDKWIVNWKDGF